MNTTPKHTFAFELTIYGTICTRDKYLINFLTNT